MTFVMYAPKGRRDFLIMDIDIEEDFNLEIENMEMLGELYRPIETDNSTLADQALILGPRTGSDTMSLLI